MKYAASIAATLLLLLPATAFAQSGSHEPVFPTDEAELARQLTAQDAALFDAAFNQCDAAKVREFLVDDFEFYDDRSGMEAASGDEFAASVAKGCRERARGNNMHLRRNLIPGSVTVEPLGHFGAMQMGKHSFSEVMADGKLELRGTGLFIHIWRFTKDGWRLAREVSYDHQTSE